MNKEKEEILNYMYELIDIIKEKDDRIIADWGNEEDLELSKKEYRERRIKAEELVAKIK